jgi:hypothetical protein
MTIIDTPGTNALTSHTASTLNLLPNADLILFVTSADRPFLTSERTLLESIQQYRKSIVIVINKMDILEQSGGVHGADEKKRVIDFVAQHTSDLLGAHATVLAVSARDALHAKLGVCHHRIDSHEDAALWRRSNFAELESFLQDTLTSETKIKSKLTNPIGVAEGWMSDCLQVIDTERIELETDVATLNLLSSQLISWRKEMQADIDRARNDLGQLLKKQGQRSVVLVNRNNDLRKFVRMAIDLTIMQQEWNKTLPFVSASRTDIQLELFALLRETADSIATRGRAQGQAVIEFLGKRPASRNQSLVGSVTAASRFEETRQNLLDGMTQALSKHELDVNKSEEQNVVSESSKGSGIFSCAERRGLGIPCSECARAGRSSFGCKYRYDVNWRRSFIVLVGSPTSSTTPRGCMDRESRPLSRIF